MRRSIDNRHQESAVLTSGIENICRKLVKFLIGRISLVKLQEIIKYLYVEEIELKLQKENPNKNIPLTQFALLSGLDTRTLTKVRNDERYRHPLHQESNFLEEITPGTSILDTWCSKAPYVDESTGLPKPIPVTGEKPSFETLFNESAKSRGVTYKSLLKRLVDSGAVSLDKKSHLLNFMSNTYLPADSGDNLGAIEMGFSALGNMIDTITHNIESLDTGTERHYQRGAWTYRLNPAHQLECKTELRKLLETTDKSARRIIGKYEDKFTNSDQITAGVSLFYFEEN